VETIVRRHRGAIAVSETAGGGATLRVSLPLVPSQSAS
jgi:signal transduction histidine kinase